MISVILPFYNASDYLNDSILSLLNQNYQDWELLLINDGSIDNSKLIAQSFSDARINYFEQKNKGVSSARNLGLSKMKGDYFCFLDADDLLPPKSLLSRIEVLQKKEHVYFVDGKVEKRDVYLKNTIGWFQPSFTGGNPLHDLVSLSGKSFFGPSWMVRRKPGKVYKFKEGLTHAEDLLFYLELAREGGEYSFVKEVVYIYRDSPGSAMKDLEGLERGYKQLHQHIKNWSEITLSSLLLFKLKTIKFMFLSYLREGKLLKALKALV